VEDSVYVHRELRGRGLGRLLLGALVDLARDHGFHSVIGRIVGDHDASIALHAAFGFEEVGREREIGRKFNRWLDVVTMQKLL
jgi:phosphinothricin acetyltransferase